MGDYDTYNRYVEYNMSDVEFMYNMTNSELIKELIKEYDNECSDWFEDETFVEKEIPEFNFV